MSLTTHGAQSCLVVLISVTDVSLLHCVLRSLNNFTQRSVSDLFVCVCLCQCLSVCLSVLFDESAHQ